MMELNNIRLLVKDFDRSFTFYKDTLGLKPTWGEPGGVYASFDIGLPSGLCLFKAELMTANKTQSTTNNQQNDRFVIIIKVDSVDEKYEELKNLNVNFVDQPIDMADWGIRVVHFRDPEGNLIELFSELNRSEWSQELQDDAKKYE